MAETKIRYEARSRLNQILNEKGLNQKELAEMAGLTAATISRFKSQSRYDISTLFAISKALELSIEDLFIIEKIEEQKHFKK